MQLDTSVPSLIELGFASPIVSESADPKLALKMMIGEMMSTFLKIIGLLANTPDREMVLFSLLSS